MKEFVKFALKAGVAVFVLGLGTKLGKDAIDHLRIIQDQKNFEDNERR